MGWDGYDDLPVAALLVEFRMPNIERYTGIGCSRIHLQLYSIVMRWHRLDEGTDDHAIPFVSEWCRSALVCLIGPFEVPSMAVRKGITRGLWADSSPSDSKEKKSRSGSRPSDVGTIGTIGHRPAGPTYLHPAPQSIYATQAPQRPLVQFHQQYKAPLH
ncbi:hypothetical protein CK203_057614 [Vitis vinifera]|uniref:Uncharacterized protein n=1 Tax=Vitis vinifera TaxID=29760 RepID=A0A438GNK5_VITVI|nr:hypothetical protein CK203_057614 [Vitis vinifera]